MGTLARRLGLKDGRASVSRWVAELEQATPPAIARVRGSRSKNAATVYRLLLSWSQSAPNGPAPGQLCLLSSEQQSVVETATEVLSKQQQPVVARAPQQTRNKPGNKPGNKHTRAGELELVKPAEILPASTPNGAGLSATAGDGGFSAWWADYPRKVDKRDAAKAYARAVKEDGPDRVREGLAAWIASWRDRGTGEQYIPYPSTFLNKARYLDPPPAARSVEPRGWAATREYMEERRER
jgi:hypothetical protein